MAIKKTLALLFAALPLLAYADDTGTTLSDDQLTALPTTFRMGFERVKLLDTESMGLLSGTYLINIAPDIYVGPAVYGAATGKRGGFFTAGGDVVWKTNLFSRLNLSAGLYVGGGGGGVARVGGGLMVRPHVDLFWKFDRYSVGITGSQVRFPNGEINSKQVGVMVAVDDELVYSTPANIGKLLTGTRRGGIGFDRISVVGGQYYPAGSAKNTLGQKEAASTGYMGFRSEQTLSPNLYWGLESGAAIKGSSDGYAEVLAVLGSEYPVLSNQFQVGARVSAGVGGGGKISTGGGVIGKAALTGRVQLSDRLYVGIEGGLIKAPGGQFQARFATANIGITLDGPSSASTPRLLQGYEWGTKVTRYANAERYNGGKKSFDTFGFVINRNLTEHIYSSAQALTAFDGKAGGFSMGLVGLGLKSTSTSYGLSFGAEALFGGAGGGGVRTEGGAVAHGLAFAVLDLKNGTRIKAGIGRVHSFKGAFRSNAFDIVFSVPYSLPGV